jgi:hypothetical protein
MSEKVRLATTMLKRVHAPDETWYYEGGLESSHVV